MSNDENRVLGERAAALRQAFDQAFAAVPAGAAAPKQAFLAIGISEDRYALRLSELSELFVDKKVVPVPTPAAELLGIASFRGTLVPVYDLRVLLGYAAGAPPRWLALVADRSIGLAFDRLDGYLDLPAEAIAPAAIAQQGRQHLTETLSAGGVIRPVISTASILASVQRWTPGSVR
jgi:purine-binding chemotaxis protein CheW